ncbi:glycosyltransferase [Paenibacillus sp. P96]|uniref:Glycosyltransferase n=1 Tax=Paenibacillus zeirhizosphaerae TaxID=2987519 RepID=A0ABT9FXF7_9BACL|nr:glycosyltransferase [Paenibacillus sp. P96]MDP4099415.1 glycosyltransferase [Paenibacillus sp. P96]
MITISLCMIVKNEEEGLDRCLSSIKDVVDEFVIVDTGSTDRTKEIASKYAKQVYDFKWIDDFAAARNFSFSKATKEFIMWLDADDVIDETSVARLKELKRTLPPGTDRVTMPYNLGFDASGNVTFSLRRFRLVRRSRNFKWEGPVHEVLITDGPMFNSEVAVAHNKNKPYTDRNLQIYMARERRGEEFTPRDLYYYGNELRDNGRHEEAIQYYIKFLDTKQGWIEDNIQACLKMGDCYNKMEKHQEAVAAMSRSLWYDAPRPEYCSNLGDIFLHLGHHQIAVYWYKQAISMDPPPDSMAMTSRMITTWYPHLQICLCYDKLGQRELASEHNEKALAFSPQHPSMLYNRQYFMNVLGDRFVRGEGTPEIETT